MTLHKIVMAVFLWALYDITAKARDDNCRLLVLETFQHRQFHDQKDSANFPQLHKDLFQGGGGGDKTPHLPNSEDPFYCIITAVRFYIPYSQTNGSTGAQAEVLAVSWHRWAPCIYLLQISLTTRFNTINCFVFLKISAPIPP